MEALSHLTIAEIGSAATASYCARLFADFGATVQKIEPPQGDPLRRSAPLTPKGQSAWFAFLNFNKSSIALDAHDAGASARLHRCPVGRASREFRRADGRALTRLSTPLQPHPFASNLGESIAKLMPVDPDVFQLPVFELA